MRQFQIVVAEGFRKGRDHCRTFGAESVSDSPWGISQHPGFILEKPAADGSIHQIWQDSFKALPLWSSWLIWQKINYIHANPVKAGAKSAKDYRWSSFRAFYQNSDEPLAIDRDWWWPDGSKKLAAEMKDSAGRKLTREPLIRDSGASPPS